MSKSTCDVYKGKSKMSKQYENQLFQSGELQFPQRRVHFKLYFISFKSQDSSINREPVSSVSKRPRGIF